ncbi:heat shock protein [Cyclospora cayetanensis]|uniref:Heat shock protein n=1 Tax=Cyclospora cayetanensis TaxID=88456 RepID=A0A1D3D9N2_9EIME|nr:heat shock protein [Cyclospora cayetanensis]
MAVLGIDIGTQSSVLATIHKGSVSVVRTELADRLTPSLVLFAQGHRLMGDHAAPLVRSQAKACCRGFKNLLGEAFSGSSRVERERMFQLAEIAEAPGGVAGFKVMVGDAEEVISATRVCAALLTKLKQVAEVSTQRPVGEVVIACPAWFREANREALLDAAQIAGLPCLRIISDMTATALDYGLYRRQHFSDAKTIVAFVSIGHSTASVCISSFTSSGAEVLAQVSNPDLGGRDMDLLIAEHFAKAFEKKHGMNPMTNVKAKLKLEDQAERAKKILSANIETTFAVECLMDEKDWSGPITRKLFEELCQDTFKPLLLKLLQQAITLSGVDSADIAHVEAIGGCTRIPWIQRCISEAFGKGISRTLVGDECVARGCALQVCIAAQVVVLSLGGAAMASLHFKVREFDFSEKLWYPLSITWSGEGPLSVSSCTQPQPADGTACSDSLPPVGSHEIELPVGTPTNSLRKITFLRSGSFDLRVAYKDLGRDCKAADLGGCRVELPEGCGPREVHVFCSLNYNGLVRFPRACMKSLEADVADASAEQGDSAAGAAAGGESSEVEQQPPLADPAAGSPQAPPPAKTVTEVPVHRIPCASRLTEKELQTYRELELQMENEDRRFKEIQARLNELETEVYAVRDDLGGPLSVFASSEEKAALLKLLEDLEMWVGDHQDDPKLTKSAIGENDQALKKLAGPVQYRRQQSELRQVAVNKLRATIQESRQAATGGSPDYAHIELPKMQQLLQAAEADEAWLNRVVCKIHERHPETLYITSNALLCITGSRGFGPAKRCLWMQLEELAAIPLFKDPSILAEQIDQRCSDLETLAKKILSTPKPRPLSPVPPPPATEEDIMDVEGVPSEGTTSSKTPHHPQQGASQSQQTDDGPEEPMAEEGAAAA